MPLPSVAELREKGQPPGLLDRRSKEHWAGRLYMRRLSPYGTKLFLAMGWSPNQVTALMTVSGVAAGFALLWDGLPGALLAALFVQGYLLLDCSDGELARYTGQKSNIGIYLDRVGAYFTDAAVLVGLGFRAAGGEAGSGYAVLGLAAALGAILIKAETDLVHVARAQSGLDEVPEEAAEPRNAGLAKARKAAMVLKFHRLILGIELSLVIVLAALVDLLVGDLIATRVLVVACAAVAAVQVVLHLVSVLVSRRLS